MGIGVRGRFRKFKRLLSLEQLSHRMVFASDLSHDMEGSHVGLGSLETVPASQSTVLSKQSGSYPDTDGTLRHDASGLAYHFDSVDGLAVPSTGNDGMTGGVVLAGLSTGSSNGSAPAGSPPVGGSIPLLHSNPTFTKKLYLDFDGQLVSGTEWNNQNYTGTYNTGAVINAPPFSTDADLANYSASELATIHDVWARVAEDYAPFQVDVTTENPGASAFTAGGQAIRALVTTDVDATTGVQWFPLAGGVAYLNSWNFTSGAPVFIFANHLGNGFAKYVAEAASHEVGHSLNLSHDGRTTPSESYYAGHGSGATGWAPIMGVGYYQSLSQWSKGEYANANNTQDDLAIITSALPYIADDYGNNAATASPLNVDSLGNFAASGLISTQTDVDAFRFATQGGSVTLKVEPFDFATGKANLDAQLTLVNANGVTVAVVNDPATLNATLTTTLTKGIYTLLVDGVGKAPVAGDEGYSDYDSLGKYSIAGTVVPNHAPIASADSGIIGSGASLLIDVLANDSDPDGDTLTLQSVGTPPNGSAAIESGKIRFIAQAGFVGQSVFNYSVVDELGATSIGTITVNVVANTAPSITANQTSVSGNEGTVISNSGTWSDPDTPPNNVSLSASLGNVTKNADGTWVWNITALDQVSTTTVTITANDGLGGIRSVSFFYTANNVAPVLTVVNSVVSGAVLSVIANNGTYADVPADTVTLAASIGTVVENPDGTWSWSWTPTGAVQNQTVTLTAQDEDGGGSSISFTVSALVALTNRQVYYKGSAFADISVDAALDSKKILLQPDATPQTTSFANVSSYVRGINGVVLDVAGLTASALRASDLTLRVAPPRVSGVVNPSTWGSAPAPNLIVVTPGTNSSPGRIRLEWADNEIQNTWLQVIVKASVNTGLTTPAVFYLGHALGEVNGVAPYRVTVADMLAIQPAISNTIVSSNEGRDLNKDRRVTVADMIFVQTHIANTVLLNNIIIPPSGSSGEGAGGLGGGPLPLTSSMSPLPPSGAAPPIPARAVIANGSESIPIVPIAPWSRNLAIGTNDPNAEFDPDETRDRRVDRAVAIDPAGMEKETQWIDHFFASFENSPTDGQLTRLRGLLR